MMGCTNGRYICSVGMLESAGEVAVLELSSNELSYLHWTRRRESEEACVADKINYQGDIEHIY